MPRTHIAAGDLAIVESPAMAQIIERYPGPGLRIGAGFVHLRRPTAN